MTYNNPPIVEAIFDIRVNNTEISNLSQIEELKNSILKDFPIANKRINFEGKIELNTKDDNLSSSHQTNATGFIFSNKVNNRKIQFRTDGYTCNFLKPYTNWSEFSELAFLYWDKYKEFAEPSAVTRIALRFINKIEIPLKEFKFETYLNNVPRIPKSFPQTFHRFFNQMQIPCGYKNTEAIISQTFENPESNYLPYIMDIDVFHQIIMLANEDFHKEFDQLRIFKNRIFEDLITDKTRELFN